MNFDTITDWNQTNDKLHCKDVLDAIQSRCILPLLDESD
jgi:hypothetical protein